jgi:organic radical activating enzyme
VPAVVYEDQDQILMRKRCEHHGEITSVVETDPEFYYSLSRTSTLSTQDYVLIDVTDRCQLKCPHCYHLPDNSKQDKSTQEIIDQLSKFPRTATINLAGAEPTLRSNFVELCSQVRDMNFKEFSVLTNGVTLSNQRLAKQYFDAGLHSIHLGLNHHSYQGKKVHNQQLSGLANAVEVGYHINYVGYTLQSLDDLPEVLIEIYKLSKKYQINEFRIRCGSFIGRSSDPQRSYLSVLMKKATDILGSKLSIDQSKWFANPYKLAATWNNISLRFIQWPDVTNIDMEELTTGTWAQFYDGAATNFVHNVITRDAYINNKMPKLDLVPQRYQYTAPDTVMPYWKETWTGPTPFSKFEYPWVSDMPRPVAQHQTITFV